MFPRRQNLHHPMYERQKPHILPDLSFCQLFQTSLVSFIKILEMIQDHHIFQNEYLNPQNNPVIQLAVALCRFGFNENGEAIHQLENIFSVGYATINLYTKRVMIAALIFWSSVLFWSTKEDQKEIYQLIETENFPGFFGFVDGTTIPLSQKYKLDGNQCFDWKK